MKKSKQQKKINQNNTSKQLRNALQSLTIVERDNLESHLDTEKLSISETLNSKNIAFI
jgi:hypothetical protein